MYIISHVCLSLFQLLPTLSPSLSLPLTVSLSVCLSVSSPHCLPSASFDSVCLHAYRIPFSFPLGLQFAVFLSSPILHLSFYYLIACLSSNLSTYLALILSKVSACTGPSRLSLQLIYLAPSSSSLAGVSDTPTSPRADVRGT